MMGLIWKEILRRFREERDSTGGCCKIMHTCLVLRDLQISVVWVVFEVETLKVKVKAETQTFPIKFSYKIRLGLPLYDPYIFFKKENKR